jgi:DNA polymerase-3 subunit gamma/tau
MLGTIDRDRVAALLQALADGDGEALLARIESLAEQSPDFAGVLAELNSLLHRIALVQQIPAALDESLGDGEVVRALAAQLSPEAVQLYYQIGILGRRDLPLAPEPRSGFEMVLLRMLAFRPAGHAGAVTTATSTSAARGGTPFGAPSGATMAKGAAGTAATGPAAATPPPGTAQVSEPPAPQMATTAVVAGQIPAPGDAAGWASLVAKLPLTGMTRQMAEHCALVSFAGGRLVLELDPAFENMRNPKYEEGLRQALGHYLAGEVRLVVGSGAGAAVTPVQLRKEQQASDQATAEEAIAGDPALKSLLDHFDGTIQPGSVRPAGQG